MQGKQASGPGRFRRVIEDFKCFNCDKVVKGKGYTDHCPECLWSLHVDNFPGDRASDCRGRMKPIGAEYKGGSYVIRYLCLKCRMHKNFKAAENDNEEFLVKLL